MCRQLKLFLFLIVLLTTTAFAANDKPDLTKGVWRLDGWDSTQVRNFRIASSNTSASAQLSLKSFSLLKDVLSKETLNDTPIYIVDLRQESHGFANNMPVSWYTEHNQANAGKSSIEVEKDESARLNTILGKIVEFIPLGKHDEATFNKLTMPIKSIQTEREIAIQTGFKYVRFAAADMMFPAPEVVDEFIKFYQKLPKNYWLHFHCHAGHGRTTTFLVFHDILTYPDLTLEEIVNREYALGGSNLLATNDKNNDWYALNHRERAKKLRQFYQYVKEQRDNNFAVTWSNFINKKL